MLKRGAVTLLCLILVLGVVGISGCTNSGSSTSSSIDPDPVKGIVILNSSGQDAAKKYPDGAGDYVIDGKLKNNNTFNVSYVEISAKGYDKNGNLVSNATGYAEGVNEGKGDVLIDPNVPAGSTVNFVVILDDPNDKIVKYELEVVDATKGTTTLTYSSNSSSSGSSSNSSSSATSDNYGEDYDRGYDSGYQNGVNDAYYEEGYYDGLSKTLQVSSWYIAGYKDGYKQGYNTIKNGRSLERPQLSWDAYMDPRTGETIE